MFKKLSAKLFIYLYLLLSLNYYAKAQTTAQKNRQELGLAFYNIGFGGVTAGFGAIINRKKGVKPIKAFLRGFKYGCIGGGINYVAKIIDYGINDSGQTIQNNKSFLWAWPTKIVHSIGSSIIDNAAASRKDVFKNYNMPIGFINLSVNFESKLSIRPQLMPASTVNFVYSLCKKGLQFMPKESLLLGTPFFEFDFGLFNNISAHAELNSIYKGKQPNVIYASDYYEIMAHEHIHILQLQEYYVFNTYFTNSINNIMKKHQKLKKLLSTYLFPDFPFQNLFYLPMKQPSSTYYKNIFELEAQHFATNTYIGH